MKAQKVGLFSIDLIKVLAFFGIFVFHLLGYLNIQDPSIETGCTWGKFSMPAVCVALFFLVSGYGLMKKDGFSVKEFYLRRCIRILIPYLICNALYFAFLVFRHRSLHVLPPLSIADLFFWLTGLAGYLNVYGSSFFSFGMGEWFLGALLFMYLLFPLLRLAVVRLEWKFVLAYAVFYVLWVCFYPISRPIYTDLLAKLFPFIIGMYLKVCPVKQYAAFAAGGGAVLLLSFFPILFLDRIEIEYFIVLDALSIFVLFLPINLLINEKKAFGRLFHKASQMEYGMFLCHHVILSETAIYLTQNYTKTMPIPLYVLVSSLLTAVIGILVTLCSQLRPFSRKSKRIPAN